MALRAGARLLARQASAALACQGGWAAPCCACADALGRRGREWAGPQASSAGARQLRVAAWPRAAVEIKVASFGESMTEGTVAEVLKQRGDSVAEDTVILQIDTDKVTMDVRAPEGGVIDSILVRLHAAASSPKPHLTTAT